MVVVVNDAAQPVAAAPRTAGLMSGLGNGNLLINPLMWSRGGVDRAHDQSARPVIGGGTDWIEVALAIGVGLQNFPEGMTPYGSETNLREEWALGSLPIVAANDSPEHVSIANRALG